MFYIKDAKEQQILSYYYSGIYLSNMKELGVLYLLSII